MAFYFLPSISQVYFEQLSVTAAENPNAIGLRVDFFLSAALNPEVDQLNRYPPPDGRRNMMFLASDGDAVRRECAAIAVHRRSAARAPLLGRLASPPEAAAG